MTLPDTLSGEELADVLREMADRVQKNLDDGSSIRDKLRTLAGKLEEERDA